MTYDTPSIMFLIQYVWTIMFFIVNLTVLANITWLVWCS